MRCLSRRSLEMDRPSREGRRAPNRKLRWCSASPGYARPPLPMRPSAELRRGKSNDTIDTSALNFALVAVFAAGLEGRLAERPWVVVPAGIWAYVFLKHRPWGGFNGPYGTDPEYPSDPGDEPGGLHPRRRRLRPDGDKGDGKGGAGAQGAIPRSSSADQWLEPFYERRTP
jgi:hypothetical protein